MNFWELIHKLKRNWLYIFIALVICGCLCLLYLATASKYFEAQLVVTPSENTFSDSQTSGLEKSITSTLLGNSGSNIALDYTNMLTSQQVIKQLAKRLNLFDKYFTFDKNNDHYVRTTGFLYDLKDNLKRMFGYDNVSQATITDLVVVLRKKVIVEQHSKKGTITISFMDKNQDDALNILREMHRITLKILHEQRIRENQKILTYLADKTRNTQDINLKTALFTLEQKAQQEMALLVSELSYPMLVLDEPTVSGSQTKPGFVKTIFLFIILGLFTGFAAALLLPIRQKTQVQHGSDPASTL